MSMLRSFFSCYVVFLVASVLVSGHVIFSRSAVPASWIMKGRADSCANLNFFLALKQQNLDALEAKFWSVSDPNSFEYRQFLSASEINAIVAPTVSAVTTVQTWLLQNGVTESDMSLFGDSIQVKTSVAVIERIFQTEMYEFHHAISQRVIIRQFGSFSIPENIGDLVDIVVGLTNFPRVQVQYKKEVYNEPPEDDDDIAIVPQSTYGLYGVPPPSSQSVPAAGDATTSQAAISFWQGSFSKGNYDRFSKDVEIPLNITADHIINLGTEPSLDEAQINIGYLSAVNTQATNWFFKFPDDTVWLYGFAQYFSNFTNIPQVMSIGEGWWEGDTCSMAGDECSQLGVNDYGYVTRMNIELQKLGLRGVSLIVPTGDSGAHTRTDIDCVSHALRTEFPASSPYVTAVGATSVINTTPLSQMPEICTKAKAKCVANGTEIATSWDGELMSSGGGFSAVSEMPSYQSAVVQQYLASGVKLPPSTYYNASNRAIPDVSSVGTYSLLYMRDDYPRITFDQGTAVSTAIFAAIVSFLNAESIAQSGQPLGFLNPLLYQIAAQHPTAFNDVTVGDNICTEHGCLPTCKGFYAAKGWDPVTGLGTPNYPVLLAAIKKLGAGRKTHETEAESA